MNKRYMQLAIKEAARGMNNNEGGPFGAVITQNDKIIAKAHNRVVKSHDPTAHAEILAIRKAAKKLGRFDLSDCEIYTTCEPCPMCLAAIYWAKIARIYFGCTKDDAAAIDFADKQIYEILNHPEGKSNTLMQQLERESCLKLFRTWETKPDKVKY